MTLHTKEAMNDVYEMFNQPLLSNPEPVEENQSEDESDDDNYTSAGESTGTGRISANASEFGDDTAGDFTVSSQMDGDISIQQSATGSEWSENTGTGEAYVSDEDEDLSEVVFDVEPLIKSLEINDFEESTPEEYGEVTPISPSQQESSDDFFDRSAAGRPLSMRAAKGMTRLPFMTPIVEKTESSVGAATALAQKNFLEHKTPSRENHIKGLQTDDPWSSPFEDDHDVYDHDKENGRIPQPALPKSNRSKLPLEASKSHPTQSKEPVKERLRNGPIILDTQCNPMEESVRRNILDQMHPPLEVYTGYHRIHGSIAGKGADIRKFVKALTKKAGTEKTATSITLSPTLSFTGAKRTYTVRRELGRGAFAPVYLVDSEPVDGEENNFGIQRSTQEVIKMEDPPSSWEFYMICQAKRRLGVSRPSGSIVEAYEMHLFDDEGFLVEEFCNQGTLLDAVNSSRAEGNCGSAMDEQLAMFFAVELFRTVEALHGKGLIHGDLKADNVLLRLDASSPDTSWTPQYHRDGTGGWSSNGITLIDFGRGIDMRVFRPDVAFVADWKTSEADCAEMREMRPWTYQVDYHGLAGMIHSLLFGKYMEVIGDRGAVLGAGATKAYRIREGLKRYWQTELWAEVFDVLLNPLSHVEPEEGRKMPLIRGLKTLRERMEMHLEANCEKGTGLKALIRRLDGALREKRR